MRASRLRASLLAAVLVCLPAAGAAQVAPDAAAAPAVAPAQASALGEPTAAGPLRTRSPWDLPTVGVQPPSLDAATAPGVENATLVRRDGKGQFLLFALSMVVVGGATYKLGEATDIGFLESTGSFMAGAGLLAIILPFWLFI